MRSTFFGVVALTVVRASSSLAQGHPQIRDGFTVSVGVGAGSAGVTCTDCGTDRETAPALYLRLGGAVRSNLILAGEINGWSKSTKDAGDAARVTVSTVNAIAQWYPDPTGGFFVDGGLGIGAMKVEIKTPGLPTLSDNTTGLGYQVGTGYDIRVGKNFSITPYATFFGTAGGKTESSKEKIDANVAQIGLGVTWH
jgi:hypothetical protein